MNLSYDILISYSHADNVSVWGKDGEGWVTEFERVLATRIRVYLGRVPQIWRDRKLQGNDVFPEEIMERLAGVAALVAILSPNFLSSQWCPRELKEFSRLAGENGGLQVGHRSRIFTVLKVPVTKNQMPPGLDLMLGYHFYEEGPRPGNVREISRTFGRKTEYLNRIEDLAQDICRLLEVLAGGGPPQSGHNASVYLAQTSRDLQREREEVQRDLQRYGYQVLPDRDLRLVGPGLPELIQNQLAQCALSVHLMGQTYGDIPDGQDESIVALQHRLAAERDGFPRLIWVPTGLEVTDRRQARFLAELRGSADLRFPSDLLEVSLEDLKPIIRRRLLAAEEPPPDLSAGNGKRIYLITDAGDEGADSATRIADDLFRRGYDVVQPVFKGDETDETEIRLDHEENLRSCDALLVFYGAGGELWLRRKLGEIQRSLGLGRTRPILSSAIYVPQPETEEKQRLRLHNPMVIREPADGFSPRLLNEFVARLEQAGPMRGVR